MLEDITRILVVVCTFIVGLNLQTRILMTSTFPIMWHYFEGRDI